MVSMKSEMAIGNGLSFGVMDPKDPMRQAYAARRRDMQDHGTRGTVPSAYMYYMKACLPPKVIKYPIFDMDGYAPTGHETDDSISLEVMRYSTEMDAKRVPRVWRSESGNPQPPQKPTRGDAQWESTQHRANVMLEMLQAGEVSRNMAYAMFVSGLSPDEQRRIAGLAAGIRTESLSSSRISGALAVRSTLDDRAVV